MQIIVCKLVVLLFGQSSKASTPKQCLSATGTTKMLQHAGRIMKLTAVLLLGVCMQMYAAGYGQRITLSERDVPIEKVLKKIQQQTSYKFLYTSQVLSGVPKVTVVVKDATVEDVLEQVLKGQMLDYEVSGETVVISKKKEVIQEEKSNKGITLKITVRGKVLNESGSPVIAASISVKGTSRGTTTNENGEFLLQDIEENAFLIITGVNIETTEIKIESQTNLTINVKTSVAPLEETIIKGYYITTRRLNTGNVSKISNEIIQEQPVSNPLAALEGRVPGVYIQQVTGVPGGSFNVQVRGQNSIASGKNPLYVIDGVPFTSQSLSNPTLGYSIIGSGSPFNNLNASDIESIEILKDADATAIYGSRGANGVVLITTKSGKSEKAKLDINFYSGSGKVTRKLDLLNTAQYLEMRHEAFENDGQTPQPWDYDINGAWDSTRYTDWQKLLFGGTARYTDAQASISAGNINTQFLFSVGYHKESTVFPGSFYDQKMSSHLSLNHQSYNQKFRFNLSVNYLKDQINLFSYDLTNLIVAIAPNAPSVYDSVGKLNWDNGNFSNPFSSLLQKYKSNTYNLISSSSVSYEIMSGLLLKANIGFTRMQMSEIQANPFNSFNPSWALSSQDAYTNFSDNSIETWILEPQLSWNKRIGESQLNVLVGTTFQQDEKKGQGLMGKGFNSESLMEALGAASTVSNLSFSSSQYRYNAFFGRINYNWQNKYLVNITGRRDGSSRFGPGKQFANFGALGAGWIFSREDFAKRFFPAFSYGKLRMSYGTTGNDQIGDYQYLSSWSPTRLPYQGLNGLYPTRLFNPDYAWELNKKMEIGIDVGFLNDRVLISTSYFRNRSSNQLVGYSLPANTGFTSIQSNLNAVIQNTGLEFQLNTINLKTKNITWAISGNLTIPRNKLIAFPNLSSSSYNTTYEVGQPLSIVKAFHYLKIDEQTGVYQFEHVKDGSSMPDPVYPDDLKSFKKIAQNYYGGIQNSLQYRSWKLDIFFQFVKQTGRNYLYFFLPPGVAFNQPTTVLNRWQKVGDDAKEVQRFTQDYGSTAATAYFNSQLGDNSISDASFIRLKTLFLSYELSPNMNRKAGLQNFRIYIQGQNLLTITKYLGMDPESQGVVLPPLKVLAMGIHITL